MRLLGMIGVMLLGMTQAMTPASTASSMLRILPVPHTHDDVGWLQTVDGYYTSEVRWILNTVITALSQKRRRFTYVEIAYFRRFWLEASNETRATVLELFEAGDFQFNLAGWSMADEAAAHYSQVVDQQTEGHLFLREVLGKSPKVDVGWSIDPFGHSSFTTPMAAHMGMSAFTLGRASYDDKDARKAAKLLEFVWRPSPSEQTEDAEMWVHIMPESYCFAGVDYDGADVANWNEQLPTYGTTMEAQAQGFVQEAKSRAEQLLHNIVLMPYGCDFAHQNAFRSLDQMDVLVDYINANAQRFNATVEYATFWDYAQAVNALNITWPVQLPEQGDFFPYLSSPHSPWTGYFTSRAESKGEIRKLGASKRTASQLLTIATLKQQPTINPPPTSPAMAQLTYARHVEGETQHHDAVTGTEKQAVADDYGVQMSAATTAVYNVTEQHTAWLLGEESGKKEMPSLTHNFSVISSLSHAQNGAAIAIVVRNTLGWMRSSLVEVPVNVTSLQVVDGSGKSVQAQVSPVAPGSRVARNATHVLYFIAKNIPPVGHLVYFIQRSTSASSTSAAYISPRRTQSAVSIANSLYEVSTNGTTGKLETIHNLATNLTVLANHTYHTYQSAFQSEQNSGAYVFRPAVDGRIGVGSDNDGSHPIQTRAYQLLHPISPLVVLATPNGQTYNDTFSTTRTNTDDASVQVAVGRVDGSNPPTDPWGQSLSINFLPLSSSSSHPPHPALQSSTTPTEAGTVEVPATSTASSVASISFTSTFATPPLVLVTVVSKSVPSAPDGPSVFSAVVFGTTTTTAQVNVTRLREQQGAKGWGDGEVEVGYLALQTQEANGGRFVAASSDITIPAACAKVTVCPFSIPFPSSLEFDDAIVVATISDKDASSQISSSILRGKHGFAGDGTANLAITVRDTNRAGFTANIASNTNTNNLPSGRHLTISYVAFQRTFYSFPDTPTVTVDVIDGPVVQELRQTFDNATALIIRLANGGGDADVEGFVELEQAVGPLDAGHEVVSRFWTDLDNSINATAGRLVTEDNGIEPVPRIWNAAKAEVVGQNLWPASQRSWIEDSSRKLTLLSDRSHAVGAHTKGTIELLLHRHCLKDDGFGVGEVLAENSRVFPTLRLLLEPPSGTNHRRTGFLLEYPSELLFSTTTLSSPSQWSYPTTQTAMRAQLPPQLFLLTLEPRSRNYGLAAVDGTPLPARPSYIPSTSPLSPIPTNQTILRLQHIFPITESNATVSVDLHSLFTFPLPSTPIEYDLAATNPLSQTHRLHWNTKIPPSPPPPKDHGTNVTLRPRAIRTWVF